MSSIHTLETARKVADAMVRVELADHQIHPPTQVLSSEVLEAEGCWFFFMSENVQLPKKETGQLIFTAFAVSKDGASTASVYDFRLNPAQMREYVEVWSLHALGKRTEASVALDAFNAKYA
jgi:hypothetical protein